MGKQFGTKEFISFSLIICSWQCLCSINRPAISDAMYDPNQLRDISMAEREGMVRYWYFGKNWTLNNDRHGTRLLQNPYMASTPGYW